LPSDNRDLVLALVGSAVFLGAAIGLAMLVLSWF
jgi:hypothetical protein